MNGAKNQWISNDSGVCASFATISLTYGSISNGSGGM